MEWICSITLYAVFSGLLLELIADTKYYRYAKWVVGIFLLMQFVQPLLTWNGPGAGLLAKITSLEYALGGERILDELYETEQRRTQSVLTDYKTAVTGQIAQLLKQNGLALHLAEMEVKDTGELLALQVEAGYMDGTQETGEIRIPTVAPVRITNRQEDSMEVISPMELYIREQLAELYQMDENKIIVVIREAE